MCEAVEHAPGLKYSVSMVSLLFCIAKRAHIVHHVRFRCADAVGMKRAAFFAFLPLRRVREAPRLTSSLTKDDRNHGCNRSDSKSGGPARLRPIARARPHQEDDARPEPAALGTQ